MKIIKTIFCKIKNNAFIANLSWIFFGNVLHAVFGFLLSILVARVLSTSDFGLINYSASLITFFNAICTLGYNGIITKKFAENYESSNVYIGTAIKSRIVISILSAMILVTIVMLTNNDEKALNYIVLFQSITIIFSSFDSLMYWFRYKSEAKIVAIIRFMAFGISALGRIIVLFTTSNVFLYVAMTSFETVLFGLFLLYKYKIHYNNELCFSISKMKEMLHISYPFIFSAVLVTIYGQTDKIMLKNMLDNDAVAIYSVSLVLAGAISIIPSALIEGFRPDIMNYKLTNERLYKRRLTQLYAIVFWLCIVYCLFITFFSKHIILLLYGTKYINATPVLALVVWYTAFSYFGGINNLYLVAENKTIWVQIITLAGAIINIILNACFIPTFGVMGAALASLLTQFFTNFLLYLIIKPLRGCFHIMKDAILLKNIR